jgi:hypothetical protein
MSMTSVFAVALMGDGVLVESHVVTHRVHCSSFKFQGFFFPLGEIMEGFLSRLWRKRDGGRNFVVLIENFHCICATHHAIEKSGKVWRNFFWFQYKMIPRTMHILSFFATESVYFFKPKTF